MNILVLAAHPDDETLGCGGTIARLSSEGHQISLITFTDGASARHDNQKDDRRRTVDDVCDILGIKHNVCYDFPDNKMDQVPMLEVTKAIEAFVSENNFKPDIVFTHSPYCLNVDHKVVSQATLTAFRGMSKFNPIKILAYEVPSSSEWNPIRSFMPNTYFDITGHISKKIKALEVYDDEMRSHPHPRSYDNCERLSLTAGAESGVDRAERFMLLREVL